MMQCFGNFPLTKTIYRFNGTIGSRLGASGLGERLINTISLWVLARFFIYALAMIGDLILFNLVEFWTGNPMNIGHRESIKQKFNDGSSVEITHMDNGLRMEIKHTDVNNISKTYYVFRNKPGKFFTFKNGRYIEIKIEDRELNDNQFEIVYNDGDEARTIIVEKEKLISVQKRISVMYAASKQKYNAAATTAYIPVQSSVY